MVYHLDDTNDAEAGTEGHQGDTDKDPDPKALTCAASQVGQPVKITPNGTITPIIEVLSQSVSVSVGDSDGVVKADSELSVKVSLSNFASASISTTQPVVDWVRVSGVLDGTEADSQPITIADGRGTADFDGISTGQQDFKIIVPAGTAPGEYTVSALVLFDLTPAGGEADADEGTPAIGNTANERVRASTTFTIGDPGTNAASATLSLGNAVEDLPGTTRNERVPEDNSEPARDGDIWVKVQVLNSMDKPSNSGGVNTLTVIAPGAELSVHPATPSGAPRMDALGATGTTDAAVVDGAVNGVSTSGSISVRETPAVSDADTIAHTMFIKVAKAGNPPKPGSITVYALVIGNDGAPRTNEIELAFTGSASQVVLGDDVSVGKPAEGKENKAEISLGFEDAGGNKADMGTVIYKVMDADGGAVSQSTIKAESAKAGASTTKTTDDGTADVVLVTVDDSAAPGVYTIEASLSGVADSSDTASVVVAGKADTVTIEVGEANDNGEFEVTVTAKDADGELVADGTPVMVEAPDLRGDADKVLFLARSDGKTTAGMAKATLVEIGPGNAAIVVTVDGVTKVERYTSTYGAEAEAMPEPETVGTHCIRNQGGFATWTCGVEAMASEVFALVSPEGATAIHLWSTISLSWVRYSVVEGVTVPGSSDFMVAENDILYISN